MSATAETAVKIRKGRKYDQVLDGARAVFLAHGFEGASVDDIARAAGVSKATLYSYFADKRVLFMEVASQQCQAQADLALQQLDLSAPPDVVLRQGGRQFLGFVLSDMGQRIFRMVISECHR
ncbi:MAG: TetR/AcrR family transcriptional regulator, partial [Paracoccaceae bacterium]